ncbi:MAG: hypothetical protein R3Y04_06670 [Rikenellaceae bacterium]
MNQLVRCFNVLLLSVLVAGCGGVPANVVDTKQQPDIFPDFKGVTIPVNIAPLNFRVADADKVEVEFSNGGEVLLSVGGDGVIDIPQKKWKKLLERVSESSLEVKVYARHEGVWSGYDSFDISVVADSVDSHVAYRLIEPGYELGLRVGLFQRELSTFKESPIVAPEIMDKRCVNCHTFHNYSPTKFMFHSRMVYSGTILVDGDKLRKVNTKTKDLVSPGAYRMWHPSGKYIAFSNNETRQSFHAFANKKIEVYDLSSDIMIYDVDKNRVLLDSRFQNKENWETYPAWSPDGKYMYYCSAKPTEVPQDFKNLKYQLYKVAFDEQTGKFSKEIEKVELLGDSLKSTLFPTLSPDGNYLLYTVAECGNFPIYYDDADLRTIDLRSGEFVDMSVVNSDWSDSYHVWSSNGRWILFSTRRMDGLYTTLYFAYFDKDGKMHKPFILPQQDPDFYTYFLKSFNIPEFVRGEIELTPYQIKELIESDPVPATQIPND